MKRARRVLYLMLVVAAIVLIGRAISGAAGPDEPVTDPTNFNELPGPTISPAPTISISS